MKDQQAAVAASQPTKDDPTIWRVDDALWAELQPLLVVNKPRKKPGRTRKADRPILDGLIWLARTSAQWAAWPRELFGPKSTAHDRLQEWVEYGCLANAWAHLLTLYDDEIGLQWAWQAADGCLVKAPLGKKGAGEAEATGVNPTDRAKCGSKRHLLTEGRGIPLATVLTGANRTDMKQLGDLLDALLLAMPAEIAAGERHLCLDRGYDYDDCQEVATARGYTPHIPLPRNAPRPVPPPGDPARHPARRWVVEVAHSWFNRFRRLLTRWEKKAANYLGFVHLAAVLIIYRKLRHARSLSE